MKINNAWGITLISTLTLCLCLPAKAQLSNNLSVGNPVAISMANAVTARPPGTDAIHFNPAGLARIKNELTQYKLQLAYTAFEGSVSGRAPGEPFDAIEDDLYSQDPLLQGQQSRPIEVSSSNIYLPIFGHVELPFVIAPGYGFALRSSNNQFVFANSAVMVAAGGFRRDSDNVAAYAGEKVGQTTLAYFNPTVAFQLTDNIDVGMSIGFSWVGLGLTTQVRSVVHSLAEINGLVDAIDPEGDLDISISPYSDVGWLELEMEDPLVVTSTVGLLWHPRPWLSFGVSYRSPGKARLNGEYHVRYKNDFLNTLTTLQPASGAFPLLDGTALEAAPTQSGKASTELNIPQTLSTGVSVQVMPRLRVNIDLRWVDFSVINQVDTHYENPIDYLTVASMVNHIFKDQLDGFDWADPTVTRTRKKFDDVVDWSLGMEYQYNDKLVLRWGVEPRTTPISEQWMDLVQPLDDAYFFGAGFGLTFKNGQLDVGVGYMKSDIRLEPGTSRVTNSTTEGETNSLYYRGLLIEHTMETVMFSVAYLKHF
ncbi:MAG: outer membrane protein transport protein [Pseudomonadales bacterium]|nr:outer membrane protein transport protein [Pseudomonadales bacterium]